MTESDKRYSLVRYGFNYGRRKFYSIGPVFLYAAEKRGEDCQIVNFNLTKICCWLNIAQNNFLKVAQMTKILTQNEKNDPIKSFKSAQNVDNSPKHLNMQK